MLLLLLLLYCTLAGLASGAYRLSGSPREFACPSDAEEHACLYNMACCYAQLGQQQAALTCLESILESGTVDWAVWRLWRLGGYDGSVAWQFATMMLSRLWSADLSLGVAVVAACLP
jgi:hypothetical protein